MVATYDDSKPTNQVSKLESKRQVFELGSPTWNTTCTKYRRIPKIPVMFSEKKQQSCGIPYFKEIAQKSSIQSHSRRQKKHNFHTNIPFSFFRRYNWMPCYNLNATRILLVLGNDEASHIPNLIGKGLAWFGACDSTSRVTAVGNPGNARWVFQVRKGSILWATVQKKPPNFPLNPGWNCRDPYIGWLKNPHTNWVV